MNKKILVVFEGDIFDRKGLFNAVHGRIRALSANGGYDIFPYCIQCRDTVLSRKVKHSSKKPSVNHRTFDSVDYKVLSYRFSIIDWVLTEVFKCKPLFFSLFLRRTARKFKGYDLVSAHSFKGGLLAEAVSKRQDIPFTITWHGSDIHTHPWKSSLVRKETARLTANARWNFYVSEALMETSSPFPGHKMVLHNGVSMKFKRFSDEQKAELRKRYGVSQGTKVVAYAGSFFHVKNTMALPDIWEKVRTLYEGPLVFWVIGQGREFGRVRSELISRNKLNCVFFGNQPPEQMPALMNCINVLVLPSLNEGMPLVTMEALNCGCNAVGSRVGGIPEILGEENTVPLGQDFTSQMAQKIYEFLLEPKDQLHGRGFGWDATARIEDAVYKKILG